MAVKCYKKGSAERLAPNFRAREFDCLGRGCCAETKIDEKLVSVLQNIRDHFGKPVYVTAYRCPTHNAQVTNAATNSYHIYGQAADIHIDGVAPAEIAKYAESIGVLGIGLYASDRDGHFVHIDTRTAKSFWYGHAQERRTTFGGVLAAEEYLLETFIRDVQRATGSRTDGMVGPETMEKVPTVSRYVNRTHPVVKFIQKRLEALGYTQVGEADGIAGEMFDAAMKAFQRDNGCAVDGEATAGNKTWKKLLGVQQGR